MCARAFDIHNCAALHCGVLQIYDPTSSTHVLSNICFFSCGVERNQVFETMKCPFVRHSILPAMFKSSSTVEKQKTQHMCRTNRIIHVVRRARGTVEHGGGCGARLQEADADEFVWSELPGLSGLVKDLTVLLQTNSCALKTHA